MEPSATSSLNSSGVTLRFRPTIMLASGAESITYHISVLPRPRPWRRAVASSGCTCTDKSRAASMNFTSSGNSFPKRE